MDHHVLGNPHWHGSAPTDKKKKHEYILQYLAVFSILILDTIWEDGPLLGLNMCWLSMNIDLNSLESDSTFDIFTLHTRGFAESKQIWKVSHNWRNHSKKCGSIPSVAIQYMCEVL